MKHWTHNLPTVWERHLQIFSFTRPLPAFLLLAFWGQSFARCVIPPHTLHDPPCKKKLSYGSIMKNSAIPSCLLSSSSSPHMCSSMTNHDDLAFVRSWMPSKFKAWNNKNPKRTSQYMNPHASSNRQHNKHRHNRKLMHIIWHPLHKYSTILSKSIFMN